MNAVANEMESCIDSCLACYRQCVRTAMHHCLEAGGEHVAPHHFRLMMGCAEMCRTAAHAMLVGVENHKVICGACAVLCDDCAASCDGMDGMAECARTCGDCAEICGRMAS
ncbi:four-helix bundle copper-binding protein [Achromobacter spanius]|uniref:four-helix bundle copper-binding protein n=1 Tax=Achromobacter spanius TaxID=217203 RepID=UPI00320B80FA